MAKVDTLLVSMKNWNGGKNKERLEGELNYARRVSLVKNGKYDALVEKAFEAAKAYYAQQGAITLDCVHAIEEMLLPMQADCKKYKLLFIGHAHIDMNWMWRYDETVAVTLDTLRTTLNLMKEFPKFTFAQSQASVYSIVEQYEPEMIEEIKERIKAGQWEVSASTWVEADRNMPSFESVARHHLYTTEYLTKLLDIPADTLELDFEPDTFGHHQNVPEMLAEAGVKYYYHCRGEQNQVLYRWQAPSGRDILVYREPNWYNGIVEGSYATFVPEYCDKYGVDTALRVYGVGDHGGGPTRRDIETIEDMMTWPIYPTVEHGTYRRFFQAMEKATKEIPVEKGEKNPIFTGCYTTQTRIKQGNRVSEAMMFDGEELAAFAKLTGVDGYATKRFTEGWKGILFNQFHDIIPGSGVVDTREYAMARYQEAFATANSARRSAMNAIARQINTKDFLPMHPEDTRSEGAGVGYGVGFSTIGNTFRVAQVERGGGNTRIYHLFNTLPFARREAVELILWDFRDDTSLIEIIDSKGNKVEHQLLKSGFDDYCGHHFARVMIMAEVPACGYATYGMRLKAETDPEYVTLPDPRLEKPYAPKLENDNIRATFDPITGEMISLIDKTTGEEMLGKDGAQFHLVEEDPSCGMTAWYVGRWRDRKHAGVKSRLTNFVDGPILQSFDVEQEFGASKMRYTVSLAKDSTVVNYAVSCDWLEIGTQEKGIPQLRFDVQHKSCAEKYLYDIPGGVIDRKAEDIDACSQGMIATPFAQSRLVLMSDCKYGFRGTGSEMGVTLIRSSFEPDPYPELGRHTFRIAVGVSKAAQGAQLIREAQAWNRLVNVISGTSHEGTQELNKSYASLEDGSVILSAIKKAENEDSLIARLYETEGNGEEYALTFGSPVKKAVAVDSHENELPCAVRVEGNKVILTARPYGVQAVKVTF